MSRIFAFECAVDFLSEQWTEPYVGTVKGIAQLKNLQRAKNTLQDRTWFGLERCGA